MDISAFKHFQEACAPPSSGPHHLCQKLGTTCVAVPCAVCVRSLCCFSGFPLSLRFSVVCVVSFVRISLLELLGFMSWYVLPKWGNFLKVSFYCFPSLFTTSGSLVTHIRLLGSVPHGAVNVSHALFFRLANLFCRSSQGLSIVGTGVFGFSISICSIISFHSVWESPPAVKLVRLLFL